MNRPTNVLRTTRWILWPLSLTAAVIGFSAFAHESGEALVRNTVRLSLAWYLAAVLLMITLRSRNDWHDFAGAAHTARWCWTWAVVIFLVHLGMAFHYYHHWSHAHAFQRTREVSGVGEGIYVSYAFTVAWCVDVLWWWISPTRYAIRSPWVGRLLHGFLLFVIVNGTMVFESGAIRWAGAIGVGVIVWHFLAERSRRLECQASDQPMVDQPSANRPFQIWSSPDRR